MAGFIGLINVKREPQIMDSMLQTIAHRGPDFRDDFEDDYLKLSYLGIDLDYQFDGKEFFENDQVTVLLTGYVTNIDEVKDYCRRFYANSSELTPAALIATIYAHEGLDVAKIIKGGYVVTIYDKKTRKIAFIRDRFGLQPLYYYQTADGLMVVSETKALLEHPQFNKQLNTEALVPYLVYQVPVLDETFFKGVYTAPAASIIVYDGKDITIDSYWDIKFEPEEMTADEAAEEINRLIGKSIKNKLQYFNHPEKIGQSLSGGVDSSYLAARLKPAETFTVGYNSEEFSEIDNARAFSDIIGAHHTAKLLDADEAFSELRKIVYLCDVPYANLSAIPMFYLSKTISDTTHAVYSGEGADEFFGGYLEYEEPKSIQNYRKLPQGIRELVGQRVLNSNRDFKGRNFLIKGLPVEKWYIGQNKIFHENNARSIVTGGYKDAPRINDLTEPYFQNIPNYSDIQKKQYLDFHMFMLHDIALKADRMNIANSIQLVTPLLDEDLLDFARRMPDKLKVDGEKAKIAFRKAAEDYLPDEWSKRKKLGYVTPLKYWLKEDKYRRQVYDALTGSLAKRFFDTEMIEEIFQDDASGRRAGHRKIWTLYMFLMWYEEYFIRR